MAPAEAAGTVTGAQSLIKSLESAGVENIFGIPGGAILPAYDPLFDSKIRHILVRHEQGAATPPQGYAVATGKVGVCMATSGPGATNLVTPLADAYMDSVPIVAITGQVRPAAIGTDAFQEADIRGITMPITKHNYLVTDPADIPRVDRRGVLHRLDRASRPGARRRRQGRAAGDDHVQLADRAEPARLPAGDPAARQAGPRGRPADRRVAPAGALRRRRRDPRPRARRSCATLAELTGIPVVTTLMARGAFPDSHPQHLGMPGMHGTVAAVAALQRSDLIISLGARFDDRVTGKLDSFAPGAKVIHADIDPAEIGKNRARRRADRRRLPRGDRRPDRRAAGRAGPGHDRATTRAGWSSSPASKQQYPLGYDTPPTAALAPQYVIERIGAIAGPEAIYVAGRRPAPDVGRPLRQLRAPEHLDQLRRPRHDGLRGAGRDGRQGRPARHDGVGDRRRRLLPDDQPGARHLRDRRHPDQGRDHQQRVARHGAAVADAVLRRAATPTPTCSPSGSPTSSSWPRPTAASGWPASTRTTSTPRSRRRWRSTTCRWSSTSGSTATRWCGRWSRPAPATTTSRSPATWRPSSRRTTC